MTSGFVMFGGFLVFLYDYLQHHEYVSIIIIT